MNDILSYTKNAVEVKSFQMGAAQCPIRKPAMLDISYFQAACNASRLAKYHDPCPQTASNSSSLPEELTNGENRRLERVPVVSTVAISVDAPIPKATPKAIPKASPHQDSSSIPVRYRRWSYDALEEDQKRSLRMLSPLEASKLIPDLESVPLLATVSSSLNPMHLREELETLSAELVHTQGQSLTCRGQYKHTFSPATFIQHRFPPGLDISDEHIVQSLASDAKGAHTHPQQSSNSDLEVTCSQRFSTVGTKFVGEGSLRQNLELLRDRDHQCVLVVRKIKQLGFEAPGLLASHFSKQGNVEEVLVAHTNSPRKAPQKHRCVRVRPAAMGFIVMKSVEGAERVLKCGQRQDVMGVMIQVHPFSSFTKPNDSNSE